MNVSQNNIVRFMNGTAEIVNSNIFNINYYLHQEILTSTSTSTTIILKKFRFS